MNDSDEIDPQQLQAQIDLSLSFANDLVNEYLRPTAPSLPKAQNINIERDLKEYIHKPSRLGVGATVKRASDLSGDAVRLKKTLTKPNKKRPFESVAAPGPSKISDDEDEEESRAGAITKKPRLNIFTTKGKAKAKAHPASEGTYERSSPPQTAQASKGHLSIITSPSKSVADEEQQVASDLLLSSPKAPYTPKASPDLSQPISISSFSTPASPAQLTLKSQIKAELQKQPLLNLDGPPPLITTEGSPKKKRRRKRKKTGHDVESLSKGQLPQDDDEE